MVTAVQGGRKQMYVEGQNLSEVPVRTERAQSKYLTGLHSENWNWKLLTWRFLANGAGFTDSIVWSACDDTSRFPDTNSTGKPLGSWLDCHQSKSDVVQSFLVFLIMYPLICKPKQEGINWRVTLRNKKTFL